VLEETHENDRTSTNKRSILHANEKLQDGIIKLIEVNARLGGGTIFTALAGANFPKMILDMVQITAVRIFGDCCPSLVHER
jgi:hypothetical protein